MCSHEPSTGMFVTNKTSKTVQNQEKKLKFLLAAKKKPTKRAILVAQI
jgi:hypothetical protein